MQRKITAPVAFYRCQRSSSGSSSSGRFRTIRRHIKIRDGLGWETVPDEIGQDALGAVSPNGAEVGYVALDMVPLRVEPVNQAGYILDLQLFSHELEVPAGSFGAQSLHIQTLQVLLSGNTSFTRVHVSQRYALELNAETGAWSASLSLCRTIQSTEK